MTNINPKNWCLNGLLFSFLCCFSTLTQAQLYATSTGQTNFFSETPAENIRAVNTKTQVLLNTTTGEIAVRMNVRDFHFPNKLMEEHFNENYLESEKYPTSTFKGKITKLPDWTQNGTTDVRVDGTLLIHGKEQPRTLTGKISVQEKNITLTTDFEVALKDHQIDVPKIVFVKIAQVIDVKANYILTPYRR
ncbi:YceI family protein [Arundinibacter roseus]|uniref:YceI family protein n=1 Tax=Arundinibacter roseus TaxID=2070510 RepID=A0A4R4K7X5_9BACT|nr:YceI family protein [Arundinibacter roseus]TDB63718.1 YceI family protein [Arundinibacter roseus]